MDYLSTDAAYLALVSNAFDEFVVAIEKGCQLSIYLSLCAARQPDHRYLHVLYEKGCPWNELTFSHAIQHGDLPFLRWLREKGCPWDETAISEASKCGKLDVLQWLRSEGCPWDWRTGFYAAKSGHIHILEWIYEHGCPYKDDVIGGAVYSRELHVLQWFHKKNTVEPFIAYQTTAITNQVEMMEWLYLHYPISSTSFLFNLALSHHSLSILLWFLDNKFSSHNNQMCVKGMSLGIKYDLPALFLWARKNIDVLGRDEEAYLKNYENMYAYLELYLLPDVVGIIRKYY